MSFPIITADERLAEPRGVKGVLIGKSGIGKTLQLWTLPAESTLFFDLEAGDLAVEGWLGDTLRPAPGPNAAIWPSSLAVPIPHCPPLLLFSWEKSPLGFTYLPSHFCSFRGGG